MKARPSVVTWAISTRDSVPVPERPQAAICSTSRPRVYNAARRRTCPECVSWSCDCPCVFQHRPWTRSRQILAQSNQPSPAESSLPRPKPTNDQIPHRGRNNVPARSARVKWTDRRAAGRASSDIRHRSAPSVCSRPRLVEPPRSPPPLRIRPRPQPDYDSDGLRTRRGRTRCSPRPRTRCWPGPGRILVSRLPP